MLVFDELISSSISTIFVDFGMTFISWRSKSSSIVEYYDGIDEQYENDKELSEVTVKLFSPK